MTVDSHSLSYCLLLINLSVRAFQKDPTVIRMLVSWLMTIPTATATAIADLMSMPEAITTDAVMIPAAALSLVMTQPA